TRRRDPRGYPIVTKYLIPSLYDYLKPNYQAAHTYRHADMSRGPGAYPRRLMRDIAMILKAERPDLCATLKWSHVVAAISRYLQTAPPDRPTGSEMFRMAPSYQVPSKKGGKTATK